MERGQREEEVEAERKSKIKPVGRGQVNPATRAFILSV